MVRIIIRIFIVLCTIVSARDLYVSKSALEQYETDDYLLFDFFSDTLEALHSTHPDYLPAVDAIDLGKDGPKVGEQFTLEARIYQDGRTTPPWGTIMGYQPVDKEGLDENHESPFIWVYEGVNIKYGFGSGDQRHYSIVDSVILNRKTWYHIATTFDGTNYRLFVNGEEVHNTTNFAGKIPYPTPVRFIGGAHVGYQRGRFFGKIDEVRMWSVAKTQVEIQEKMNDQLTGNESDLVAYYPMDIDNQYVLDRSGNNYHGIMIGPVVKSRYFSDECPKPDGTMDCPYPTIASALEDVQAWDRIIIREGRYTEFIMKDGINIEGTDYSWNQLDSDFGGPPTNTITIEPYPNETVVIDGTISINVDWEPYYHNGRGLFRAILDSAAIADEIQRPFRDVYGLWINDRYQIPAVSPNIKNPTDPTYGGPNDHVPGTFWEVDVVQSTLQFGEVREGSVMSINREYGLARLDMLDTLEEWAFDPQNEMLYIYADERFIPSSKNVRIRVLHRMINFQYVANMEFRNIKFFGGSLDVMGQNVLFEDCKFEHLHDITLPPFRNHGPLCAGLFSWNADFINCIFSRIPFVYSVKIQGARSLVENCLFTNMDWWANPGGGAPGLGNVCRFVTFENSKIGGLGGSSLMEYCRIEDFTDPCDCSGINRGAHGAPRSMTRYNWVINGPGANGIRFDGGTTGAGNRRGDVHHLVTAGNHRGMRLKGDYHELYHVTTYDNWTLDIDLFVGKYAEPGELNQGYGLNYTPGNQHSMLRNSLVESSLGCPTPDCWPYPPSENGSLNPGDAFYLLEKGIWFGTAFGNASLHKELTNPWQRSLTYSDDSLYFDGYYRPDDRTQDYDFRPRKGSTLIDAGVVIPGINDGQDLQQNWPPSYLGQNRRFVGDAPDIGAYEYGDSVYWIPGYRYPHPSFPIPRNNAVDVIPDYSVVWNYPYKRDYSRTMASVTINGPGVDRSEIFRYPNNVMFQEFQPGGFYTWTVTVDGMSGGIWSFQVDNDIFPMNDRSIDTTLHEVIPLKNQKTLEVSENNIAFFRFDVPSTIDESWDIDFNFFVKEVENLTGGIVVYKHDQPDWGEKNDQRNIGVIDHTLSTAIDTLHSLDPESPISLNLSSIINEPGKYSFALAGLDSNDHVTFHSYEAGGIRVQGYFTKKELWPSLSFTPSLDSVNIVLTMPQNDSTIVLRGSPGDSILFQWRLTHDMAYNVNSYVLQIGLPYASNGGRSIDTLYIETEVNNNSVNISKDEILDMLVEAKVLQGEFEWDVTGILSTGEMVSIMSNSFSTVIDDKNYELTFPDEYRLYNNYPNPFNPITTIAYDLKAWSIVNLQIFDIMGRKLMTLESSVKAPGHHYTIWNGKNSKGLQMASGVYFYRLTVENTITGKNAYTKVEKMMLLK